MTAYRISAIRLINFHNFVDEAIEIRDGGHLFLLGDNGSGKTTVLDAVHYVLSGGEKLELNAAARIGGRRDDGRTLAGIVLRQDFERGVRNEGGAIAYAAVELHDPETDRRLVLGIGAEATTLEARVERWGFIAARPLAEIAFVDPAAVPLDRDALRAQLGGNHVFAQISAYRKELARRLFGSESKFEDAVRFWDMAKAYREIVAGARDFGALFAKLLPPPDVTVFDEILRTIRAIDDLEAALRDLDAQASYVRGLVALQGEIVEGREAAARYRWLACARERDEAAGMAERARASAARWREQASAAGSEAKAAELRAERSRKALERVESADAAGVLAAIRDAEARRAELAVDVERRERDATIATREATAATRAAAEQVAALSTVARQTVHELRAAAAGVAELPGSLAAITGLADEIERAALERGARLPDTATARQAAAALEARAGEAVVEARVAVRTAEGGRDAAAADLARLETVDEQPPDVAGHDAARRALAEASISAAAVYELLDPAADAAREVLAAIEALAGHAALGAFVVAPEDRERARTIVGEIAPAVRVVTALDETARLPAWADATLREGRSARARDARCALAAELMQAAAFGAVSEPSHDGAVALRGLAFRAAATEPRLIGIDARRDAHAARVDRARAELAEAERAVTSARGRAAVADTARERARRLTDAVAAASGGTLTAAWHDAARAAHVAQLAERALADANARTHAARELLARHDVDLAALRARASGVDLDELERRIAALRAEHEAARRDWTSRLGDHRSAEDAAHGADAEARAAELRGAELAGQLDDAETALRRSLDALGSPVARATVAELTHYARVTQRGDSFRSVESLRQTIADKDRATSSRADELERDGSRGVRYLVHASKFGFVYDRASDAIEDRRGQPIAGVLAELDRAIADQRSVVNEHSRTLMDTLVMGELARHLQGQIHRLHETIKGINGVLRGLRFGTSEYQFLVTPRGDRAELVELVRRLSILDEESRRQFRAWIDARLGDLGATDDDSIPELLDYRHWFEFKLKMSTTSAEGVELTQRLRQVGSGGEQGVPNYLLVLALAKLMFDAAGATVRPLLFDEAFYGIDAGRRDKLLELATELGLQLFVASPDQDGATPAVRAATTLFVVKDANHDVHLAPYYYWNRARIAQPGLFAEPAPDGPAECRIQVD